MADTRTNRTSSGGRGRRPGRTTNWLVTPICEQFEGWSDQKYVNELMGHAAVKAVALQREVSPTTGTEHMQIFVITEARKRETAMRTIIASVLNNTVNVQMGDQKWEAMKNYCTKEFYEDDHPEHPGCRKRMEGHEALEVSKLTFDLT